MDEEDGRLGPTPGHIIADPISRQSLMHVTDLRARQIGRADVLSDASTKSLCSSTANLKIRVPGSPFRDPASIRTFQALIPLRGRP